MSGLDDLPTTARPADGTERRYAIVVGIDRYVSSADTLAFCAPDAQSMHRLLTARGYQVELIHDGEGSTAPPTLATVEGAIAKVMAAADLDDVVIAYFACHGARVGERAYLMMCDTPGDHIEQGLSLSKVLAALRGRSRWVALFIDACHVGITIDPEIGTSADRSVELGGGFALLSGSTAIGISQEHGGSGVFTSMLREGLSGQAADADGGVRFSSLAGYVQARMAAWRDSAAGRNKHSRQRPVLRLEVADLVLFPPQRFRTIRPEHPSPILCAAFAPGGECIAVGCEDGSVGFWSPITATRVREDLPHPTAVVSLAFSNDGRYLEFAGLMESDTTTCVLTSEVPAPDPTPSLEYVVWAVTNGSVDVRLLATSGGIYMRAWPGGPGELTTVDSQDGSDPCADDDRMLTAIARDDVGQVYTGSMGGEVRCWNGPSKIVGRLDVAWIRAVAVSPDGQRVAAGGGRSMVSAGTANAPDERYAARLWSTVDLTEVASLAGHRDCVTGVAYSPDGRLATSCLDGVVRIFDGTDGHPLQQLTIGEQVRTVGALCLCWSPDGKTLFVGYDDGCGRLFNL